MSSVTAIYVCPVIEMSHTHTQTHKCRAYWL